jgi:hypothetical protein
MALTTAVGYKSYEAGRNAVIAEQAVVQQAIQDTRELAMQAAAEAISKIEVRNVTIRQQAETLTREVPVYRDCRNTDDGLRLINEALTGIAAQPPGSGSLSRAGSTD